MLKSFDILCAPLAGEPKSMISKGGKITRLLQYES